MERHDRPRKAPGARALGAALLTALACAALTAGALAAPAAAKPAARPSRQYTIEQFMATTSLRGASFSAREDRLLYSSDESGIFNVYSVPVAGGAASALTSSASDTTYAVSYFPGDDRILYTRDRGGDENNHLYVRELDAKERDLTPGDKVKAIFAGWTPDGRGFHVLINERDPRFFDLYRFDAASYERTLLFRDEVGYELGDVSPDGRWVALVKSEGTANSDVWLHDATTKQLTLITKHEGKAVYEADAFDAASKKLYYRTNDGSEFLRVRAYDLATGAHEEVERADWDITSTGFSHNGRYRVSRVNADGVTVLKLYDARTNRSVALPKLPEGEITAAVISRSESRMAFYVNGDRSPNNLYVLTLGVEEGAPRRLTDSLSKQVDPDDLVEARVVRFASFDGMSIPNVLYVPHQASPAGRVPALVWVHGGPGGQTRRGYGAAIQYLVNHGYVVLGINNRGSSGYGQTFHTADDRKHGREPLWDCVAAKTYLAGLPYVDPDRIGIIGGSYGGYMVLAALAFQPDVFKAGVDIFGVSNWVRTLESIPPYWESIRNALYEEIGDPGKEKEMLRAISPLFHAEKIRAPLIVLQGANDPRVIKPESDDIVAAVKKNGRPVEYVVFPDEGHGFTKKKNQVEGYGAILRFLDQHLKGEASPPAGM